MSTKDPELSDDRTKRPDRPIDSVTIMASIAFAVVLSILWWWTTRDTAPAAGLRIARVPGTAELANFVGDRACARCHPAEQREHARSGHSHTFHLAATHPRIRALAGTTHPDPEHHGVSWAYGLSNG